MAKIPVKCVTCKAKYSYSEKYDAEYCAKCNEWIASKCGDLRCCYCPERPDKPIKD